jgi:hypothetical protein
MYAKQNAKQKELKINLSKHFENYFKTLFKKKRITNKI